MLNMKRTGPARPSPRVPCFQPAERVGGGNKYSTSYVPKPDFQLVLRLQLVEDAACIQSINRVRHPAKYLHVIQVKKMEVAIFIGVIFSFLKEKCFYTIK